MDHADGVSSPVPDDEAVEGGRVAIFGTGHTHPLLDLLLSAGGVVVTISETWATRAAATRTAAARATATSTTATSTTATGATATSTTATSTAAARATAATGADAGIDIEAADVCAHTDTATSDADFNTKATSAEVQRPARCGQATNNESKAQAICKSAVGRNPTSRHLSRLCCQLKRHSIAPLDSSKLHRRSRLPCHKCGRSHPAKTRALDPQSRTISHGPCPRVRRECGRSFPMS